MTEGNADSTVFELPDNRRAYEGWIRRWRAVTAVGVVLTALTAVTLAVLQTIPALGRGDVPEPQLLVWAYAYAVLIATAALCAFGAFRLFTPGPVRVRVGPSGIYLIPAKGRQIERCWKKSRVRVELDCSITEQVAGGVSTRSNFELRGYTLPFVFLTEASFDEILRQARSIPLKVTETRRALGGNQYWVRYLISN